jgi:Ca-activated chloride channel family protein
VVIAVDISRSMLAEDVAPSRLQRANQEARRLVHDLAGDRIGLVAFAGRSYILAPLTVDGGAILLFLDDLNPDIASQGGTSLAAALAQGGQLLGASDEGADRVLVVFTDGEAHDSVAEVLDQARRLKSIGVHLVLAGEGGTKPVRIPLRDSSGTVVEYKADDRGAEVLTARSDAVLQAVGDAAEGALIPAELPDQAGAIRDLLAAYKRAPSRETHTSDLQPLAWIPLLIALAWLALQTGMRRTAAMVGLAGLMFMRPAAAQRIAPGERAMTAGRTAEAATLLLGGLTPTASDTAYYNAGTAALVAGRFDEARKALDRASRSLAPELRYRALYNLGVNALAAARADSTQRDSLLAEAEGHLKDALTLEPRSQRAKWNLELAERHRPPPPGGGSSPNPPPPKGGQPPSPQTPDPGISRPNLSQSQAEEILGSVEREERSTRARRMGHAQGGVAGVKDW